jgi:hydroxyacylglutathione hydrolase
VGVRVTVIPVTPFVQNCSLLSCKEAGKAAVVDPGGEVDRILGVAAAEAGVEIEKVL